MNLEPIDTSTTAGRGGEYELALAASLRQLAEAEWTLSAEQIPEDARQVLYNAAGLISLSQHNFQTGIATIKLQADFIAAMGNAMRAAGCDWDAETCSVVNTLSTKLRADLAGEAS